MLPCAFFLLASSLAKRSMGPHPLANLFKRSNYDESISSDSSALDYLYEVLLEIHECENCDDEIYEEIHDSSNKKHDCNDFTINSSYCQLC